MRKAPPPCCASPTATTGVTTAAAVASAIATAAASAATVTGATVAAAIEADIVAIAAATVTAARRAKAPRRLPMTQGRSRHHELCSPPDPPPVFPPSQDLPVHRRQCAQDRLQGRAAVAALRL